MKDRERERGRDTGRGESRLLAGSLPDVGLNPRAPGSRPELKADAQPLRHLGVPEWQLKRTWFGEAQPSSDSEKGVHRGKLCFGKRNHFAD